MKTCDSGITAFLSSFYSLLCAYALKPSELSSLGLGKNLFSQEKSPVFVTASLLIGVSRTGQQLNNK